MLKSLATFFAVLTLASSARAVDADHQRRAGEVIDKAISYLRSAQHESGGWAVPPPGGKQPHYPAITGLVAIGMLDDPRIDATDPSVARAVTYILGFRQPDGGIYDRVLPSYNTSICLSALARVKQPEASGAMQPAVAFLKSLQWSEESNLESGDTARVQKDSPFYGGIGYGSGGRPDLSNLSFFIDALHDAGVPSTDPAFQRALVFLKRTQMHGALNDMAYAEGSRQGGFIYSTSPSKDQPGEGESKSDTIEETLDDGTVASRLRCYGSMTYAGFKSMIYANLARDDDRVRLAYDWLRRNYTLEENPGMGAAGFYYYLLTMSRALDAWGEPTITPLAPQAAPRDWENDLIDRLAQLQQPDGSFKPLNDRWMENNPLLITAYSLIALEHAAN